MHFQSSESMEQLKDESVHLVVTSPPYLNLKDYGVKGQIGYGEEPETYDERLKTVYSEVLRVLKPGRMFCINVGDVYTTENKKYQIIPLATITILNAIESGFEYKGSIVWEKIGKDTASGGNTFMGSMYTPPKIYPSFNHEMILLFQKEGKVESYSDDVKALSRISLAERAEFSKGIWRFPGKRQTDHQAPFPFELPYRLILMYSMVGDTVLDPFMGCYDDKTEVLTFTGWKFFKDINKNTLVATEDLEGNLIYTMPINIFKYYYKGQMYRFQTKLIDLLVTPNHRMYGKPSGNDDWRFMLPQDINSGCEMRRNTNWNGINNNNNNSFNYDNFFEIPMDIWLKFFGVWLADGHVRHTGRGYAIGVTQKKYVDEFREILKQTPFEWKEYKYKGDNGVIRFRTHNKRLHEYLKRFGHAVDKYIPPKIKNLPPDKLNIFLDAFCLGDGSRSKNGARRFYTSSKELADGLQEILFKSGTCSSISQREPRTRTQYIKGRAIRSNSIQYVVLESITSLTPKFKSGITNSSNEKSQRRIEEYSGFVYCAEILPSHLLYVRRNGKACWCGNSGTTAVAAKRLNRKWVGYELNPIMKQVIKRNLARSNDNKRQGFWRVLQEIDGFRSKYKFKLKSGNTNGILYGNIRIMWLDKLSIKLTDCCDKIIVVTPNATKRIIRQDMLSIIHSESLGFLEGECVRLGEEL